jgi:glycosyltransferase involved in cell wall biosynthesis
MAKIRGLTIHPLPIRTSPNPEDFRMVRNIRKICAAHGPFDVVHGHSSKGGALARLVAVGTPAKAFYTLHGLNSMDPGMSWVQRRVYNTIEKILAMFTAGIITVSPEEQRAATSVGLPRNKARTIPNGLDQLELAPRPDARKAMSVGDKELVVGFVGRLVEQKAPEVLVHAFAAVAAAVPQARLAMVGDGPLMERLVTLSRQLEISDQIIWLGARDARQVLAGFDLFALSSRKEGLPYVILEAMAAGLPIVATTSSGVEILVEPGVNGSVVPPDNATAFAQALLNLLQKPTLLARFGEASSRLIKNFTVDRMVESTLKFYRTALPAQAEPSVDEDEIPALQ